MIVRSHLSASPAETVTCAPHPFSTDRWNSSTIKDLESRLKSQQSIPDKTAALFIGSGGLPYILRMLDGYSRLIVNDLNQGVAGATQSRVEGLKNFSRWTSYNEAVFDYHAAVSEDDGYDLRTEIKRAEKSGLCGDFAATKIIAEQVTLRTCCGDIRNMAAEICTAASEEGLEFGLVNVTNVACYLEKGFGIGPFRHNRRLGLAVLAGIIQDLPLREDAVIVDSSRMLRPQLYTRDEYLEFQTSQVPLAAVA